MLRKSSNITEECANNEFENIKYSNDFTLDVAKISKRLREIPPKYSSLSGTINMVSINKSIQFESSLERDFIFLIEFDTNVHFFLEQPLEIPYKDRNGIMRRYVPDFIVNYFDDKTEIIEIKYKSVLKAKQEELEYKFKGARDFCKKNNLIFKVLTDSDIRIKNNIELDNYKFLFRYKNFFEKIIETETLYKNLKEDIIKLHEMIFKLKQISVKDLVYKCSNDLDKQSQFIFLTWCLLANNFIKTDFSIKLDVNSIVWYN